MENYLVMCVLHVQKWEELPFNWNFEDVLPFQWKPGKVLESYIHILVLETLCDSYTRNHPKERYIPRNSRKD